MPKPLIEFPGTNFSPLELTFGEALSVKLTVQNSPILFGCRTGICGTCLIKVEDYSDGELAGPDKNEREVLEMIADHEPKARLACQIKATCRMAISSLDSL